jgi:hypothetical protein
MTHNSSDIGHLAHLGDLKEKQPFMISFFTANLLGDCSLLGDIFEEFSLIN